MLEKIRQLLAAIHLDLVLREVPATSEFIKELYSKRIEGNTGQKKITWQFLYNEWLQYEKAGPEKASRHYHRVETRYKAITTFMEEINKSALSIQEIKPGFADELSDWLHFNKKYSPNYIIKIIQLAKQIFNYGMKKQYINQNPFIFLKIKTKPKPLIALSKDELQKLMKHKFTSKRLQQVADLFLLQCFTGMAYVDLINFDKNIHIVNGFICFNRQKTETQSLIPILDQTKELLEKYNYELPSITNQKYNSYIKEIADITGIEKKLTSHVGRKTCGSIFLNEGVSIEVVSRILGHSDTIITSKVYAQVNEYRISREMEMVNI